MAVRRGDNSRDGGELFFRFDFQALQPFVAINPPLWDWKRLKHEGEIDPVEGGEMIAGVAACWPQGASIRSMNLRVLVAVEVCGRIQHLQAVPARAPMDLETVLRMAAS